MDIFVTFVPAAEPVNVTVPSAATAPDENPSKVPVNVPLAGAGQVASYPLDRLEKAVATSAAVEAPVDL